MERFSLPLPHSPAFWFYTHPPTLPKWIRRVYKLIWSHFLFMQFFEDRNSYQMSLGGIKEKLQTKYSSGIKVWISPRLKDNTICSFGGRRKDIFLTLSVLFLIPCKHEKLAAGCLCAKLRPSSTYPVWRNSEALPVWGHDLRPEIAT